MRRRKLKGKIVVLDANSSPQPAPFATVFDAALQRHQDLVEYIPAIQVGAVEPATKRVVSADGEPFSYDVLSLIPPHRAARFIQEAGLAQEGDAFAEVDPVSFRSAGFETIYAIGDAARTPYSRTASTADAGAEICARAMARALGAGRGSESATFESLCYPYVNSEQALLLRLTYALERTADVPRVSIDATTDTNPNAEYLRQRRAWEQALLKRIFGV